MLTTWIGYLSEGNPKPFQHSSCCNSALKYLCMRYTPSQKYLQTSFFVIFVHEHFPCETLYRNFPFQKFLLLSTSTARLKGCSQRCEFRMSSQPLSGKAQHGGARLHCGHADDFTWADGWVGGCYEPMQELWFLQLPSIYVLLAVHVDWLRW